MIKAWHGTIKGGALEAMPKLTEGLTGECTSTGASRGALRGPSCSHSLIRKGAPTAVPSFGLEDRLSFAQGSRWRLCFKPGPRCYTKWHVAARR